MHSEARQCPSVEQGPLKECHRGRAGLRHCSLCLALETPEENTLIWKADDKTQWTSFIHSGWLSVPQFHNTLAVHLWPQIVWPRCFSRLTHGQLFSVWTCWWSVFCADIYYCRAILRFFFIAKKMTRILFQKPLKELWKKPEQFSYLKGKAASQGRISSCFSLLWRCSCKFSMLERFCKCNI